MTSPPPVSASREPLFTLHIATTGGRLVCTEPSPRLYLLTLTSPPDNRLTTEVCQTLLLALDVVEQKYPPGVLVTTSGIQKFYSNGLDLEHATSTPGFWESCLWPVFRRFISYPMPTVALINGHAFAGGLMLAMYHDYRLFNPRRGFLCLNELDFGVALMAPMSSIFRQKLPSPHTYRDMVLEAKRYTAPDAVREGIVDALGTDPADLLAFVTARRLLEKTSGAGGASGVYGAMKAEMWRETLDLLDRHATNETRAKDWLARDDARKTVAKERVQSWRKVIERAKL